MKVLVLTGTFAPFERLISAMLDYRERHPDVTVVIQHGPSEQTIPPPSVDFMPRAKVIELLAEVDAVVCHAGSGTIADALGAGHVPILVPRLARFGEIINDHQLDLAEELVREGRALVPAFNDLDTAINEAAHRKRLPAQTPTNRLLIEAITEEVERHGSIKSRRREIIFCIIDFISHIANKK